ncbi:hypothetical protein GCM10022409_36360 [Hymenobacter glaciei]|uniref:STAS domain-containing protein n=1 Tax=Hymenobacter glaciei TaxID=877209 RepID=A0ABP7ULR4_9BACT
MKNKNIYNYSLIDSEKIVVFISEEYFFPDFVETIEFIEVQAFYSIVRKVFLDFSKCKFLHGIGMSLETQLYFEKSKSDNKLVYWIGNNNIHAVVRILAESHYDSSDIIPYYSTIEEVLR